MLKIFKFMITCRRKLRNNIICAVKKLSMNSVKLIEEELSTKEVT